METVIADIIDKFDTIALEDSGKVKFLKRSDYKYLSTHEQLEKVLEDVKDDYLVMTIKGARIQGYTTTYFDTDDNYFYLSHHNGRNNRIKIRKREYMNTGERFFEIKRKTLSGQTTKKRINSNTDTSGDVNSEETDFMHKYVTQDLAPLSPKINTSFQRITLVSKAFNERVTIDLDLGFSDLKGKNIGTKDLFIIEVKCDKLTSNTPIRASLKRNGVHPGGFSKYCMGRAIADETLKQNRFKRKLKIIKEHAT